MENTTESAERLITVQEFDRMWRRGIIGPEERLELIEGRLVRREMMNAPHASVMLRMTQRFQRALGDRALISAQLPIVANERSKPFPDVALVRIREDYYAETLPGPSDVLAIVEVSDARLHFDRGVKLRLYAQVGIPEYWIADVKKKRIEVHRDPHDLGYGFRNVATKTDSVSLAAFPDVAFRVEDLVG